MTRSSEDRKDFGKKGGTFIYNGDASRSQNEAIKELLKDIEAGAIYNRIVFKNPKTTSNFIGKSTTIEHKTEELTRDLINSAIFSRLKPELTEVEFVGYDFSTKTPYGSDRTSPPFNDLIYFLDSCPKLKKLILQNNQLGVQELVAIESYLFGYLKGTALGNKAITRSNLNEKTIRFFSFFEEKLEQDNQEAVFIILNNIANISGVKIEDDIAQYKHYQKQEQKDKFAGLKNPYNEAIDHLIIHYHNKIKEYKLGSKVVRNNELFTDQSMLLKLFLQKLDITRNEFSFSEVKEVIEGFVQKNDMEVTPKFNKICPFKV